MQMVYDRTLADATYVSSLQALTYAHMTTDQQTQWNNMNLKGAWNYTDANRVNQCLQQCVSQLALMGYDVSSIVIPEAGWTASSDFYLEDLQALIDAMQSIYNHYFDVPEWSSIEGLPTFNYVAANALEHNLQLVNDAIVYEQQSWMYSGEVFCGEV